MRLGVKKPLEFHDSVTLGLSLMNSSAENTENYIRHLSQHLDHLSMSLLLKLVFNYFL